MIRGLAVVAAVALLTSGGRSPPGLAGTWQVCLNLSPHPELYCGTARIDTMLVIEEGGLWPDMQFYRFAHDLDFTQMLGAEGTYLGSFGTLVVSRQPDRLNLWLGLREKTLIGWDGGWIVAELRQRPDSLYGKWSRTCRGCRGNGRIVFRRHGP